jgi:hypothetical protein
MTHRQTLTPMMSHCGCHGRIDADSLAQAWMAAPNTVPTLAERKAFRLWLLDQFAKMRAERIEPLFVTREVSIDEAMSSLSKVALPGEIRWLPISRLHNEPNPDLMSTQQNLMFRAVHDFVHHKIKADATFEGELSVTLAHIESAPPEIHWLLWSEVACQAAVTISTGQFPQQKLAKLL